MKEKTHFCYTFCAGLLSLGLASTADAVLVKKLGDQVVYDTDLDITWLADGNLSATNQFGVAGLQSNGAITFAQAEEWLMAMNADGGTGYLGFSDWRLPTTLQPDPSCDTQSTGSFGLNCMGSEMGHLFYVELDADANTSILDANNPVELAKFSTVVAGQYWSGTEFDADQAWSFATQFGIQSIAGKQFNLFVWAVRGCDVSVPDCNDVNAVPVPAAVWLFGSGLLGLVGIARRKKT